MEEKYFSAEGPEAAKNSQFRTKNVSNNLFDLSKVSGRQTFCREEKLKRAVLIDKLFSEGKRLHSNNLTLIFLPAALSSFYPVQAAFSVPKRNFKSAVTRNMIKRRMREAYRKRKFVLYEKLTAMKMQFAFCWIYKSKSPSDYKTIEGDMEQLIQLFCRQL